MVVIGYLHLSRYHFGIAYNIPGNSHYSVYFHCIITEEVHIYRHFGVICAPPSNIHVIQRRLQILKSFPRYVGIDFRCPGT